MNDLPSWVQVSQALVTPTIAGAVALIGLLQWRTAHQKVILDLFERRLKVYESVNDAIRDVLATEGNMVPMNAAVRLHAARSEADFLFGADVTVEIDRLISMVREFGPTLRQISNRRSTEEQLESAAARARVLEEQLGGWREPFTSVCRPYLKMDQKRVRTPAEWLRDRNELRKSFDDQK